MSVLGEEGARLNHLSSDVVAKWQGAASMVRLGLTVGSRTDDAREVSGGDAVVLAGTAASEDFRDNDPSRSRTVLIHLWWNSRLRERRFVRLIYEARALTKQRISVGAIRSGEPGSRRAMPYFISVLHQLIQDDATAPRRRRR